MEDDEGSLGKGLAFGAAIGGTLLDAVQVEFSVTRMHHERSVAISWEGHITSYVARIMYRGGGPGSTVRWFAGAGRRLLRLRRHDQRNDLPVDFLRASGRSLRLFVPAAWSTKPAAASRSRPATTSFVRPELWVTIPRGARTAGGRTPEPPFLIARSAVVAGLRF